MTVRPDTDARLSSNRRRRRFKPPYLLALCGAVLGVGGCATTDPAGNFAPSAAVTNGAAIELAGTPFFPQEDHQCGPAALATTLQWSGVAVTPAQLAPQVYTPGRKGSLQDELIASTRRHGRVPFLISPSLEALLAELGAGHPVLVLQNLGLSWLPRWHYAVVVGYDPVREHLVLRSGRQARRITPVAVFERTWARADRWALVTLPPDSLPADTDPERWLRAVAGLERSGAWDAVEAAYRTALGRWTDNPHAALGLGNARYAQHDLEGAETAYRSATAAAPALAPAWNNLAQVLMETGRLTAAEAAAERAVSLGGALLPQYRETLEAVRARRALPRRP